MNRGQSRVDQQFVLNLFANQTFREELARFQKKEVQSVQIYNPQPAMLVQSYRESVDHESFSLYQTYSQMQKEIEAIKSRLLACESNKTECSSAEKEKQQDLSLFSEVSIDWQKDQKRTKNVVNFDGGNRVQQSSFIGSFLMDNGAKELREQIEEKLKMSVLNLSGDLSKFETEIEQRLKNIEVSLNKKVESIYKTLSTVIESVNEIHNVSDMKGAESAKQVNNKEKLNNSYFSKLITGKLNTGEKIDKPVLPVASQVQPKESTRRRSFLGFNI